MSMLLPNDHRKGNPNWVKGKSANPAGRPKGSFREKKVKDQLAERGRSAIEELVILADQLKQQGKLVDAAEIWLKIQEYVEPKKKPVETAPEKPLTPEQSKENVEEMLKLLEEADDGRQEEGSSNTNGLEPRKTGLQTETSPEDNQQEPEGE